MKNKPMKVGFYLVNIKPSDGGIFQYSIYILKMLLNCDKVEHLHIFYSKDQQKSFADFLKNQKVSSILYIEESRIKTLLRQLSEFMLTRYYMRVRPVQLFRSLYKILNPERRFLNKFKIDLLHVPRQHAPAYELNYPVIITMHDVQHLHYPEFFTPLERIHKAIRYFMSIKETDHVIVSFNHVKKDLLQFYKPLQEDKISICPVPLSEDWFSTNSTPEEELRKKYNLPDVFILTPAATWEHKNHFAVLEAVSILHKENFKIFWIATGYRTPFYTKIAEKIKTLGLQNNVLFTGVVSESDLKGLYEIANLVIIPTLYEAGSGPLFEAMRYGTTVICSNVTSLPETIGNIEFTFDPLNILEIAALIKRGLTDEIFISRNKENSKEQSDKLKMLDYQDYFINTYTQAVNNYKFQSN